MLYPRPAEEALWSAVPGFVVLVLALSVSARGGTDTGQEETADAASSAGCYVLPGEEVYPEGVAYRPENGDFFVGSTTDGTVFQDNVEDGSDAEVLLEPGGDGRETAVGMEVDRRGRLYIAGGDTGRIFVYDIETGELVRQFDTPQSPMTFINDVTVTPAGTPTSPTR
jgi:sugar lactone lactonase YvrE